jgi:hypothetical protein
MTTLRITEQIAIIEEVTAKAAISPAAAAAFLNRAGIKATPKKATVSNKKNR